MSAIHVLVDDSDPRIDYYGGTWFQAPGIDIGSWGPVWNNTLHGTRSNASFTFSFKGTAINLYTTNTSPTKDPSPVWQCSIDGIAGEQGDTTTTDTNNLSSCRTSSDVEDATHVFTVNVTVPEGQTAWVDYLDYTPSITLSLANESVLVQNQAPNIQYSEGWTYLEDVLTSPQDDISSSAVSTNKTGSSVRVSFTGISLAWYGLATSFVPNSPTNCTYSIDDGSSESIFQTIGRDARSTADTEYYIPIFETANLAWGPHTINVVYEGTPENTPLILDYITIQNQTSPSLSIMTAPSSSNSTTPTSLPSPSNTDTTSKTGSIGATRSVNIGRVIGGSFVGTVALLMLLIAAFMLLRRKRRRVAESNKVVMAHPFTNPTSTVESPISPISQVSSSELPPPYDFSHARIGKV